MHVLGYGYSLKMINLARKTSSLEEMKNAIKEYINSNKLRENEWICGVEVGTTTTLMMSIDFQLKMT